jgi:hypothetical protein
MSSYEEILKLWTTEDLYALLEIYDMAGDKEKKGAINKEINRRREYEQYLKQFPLNDPRD